MKHFYDQYAETYYYNPKEPEILAKVATLSNAYAQITADWDGIEGHSSFPLEEPSKSFMRLNFHDFFEGNRMHWLLWDTCMIDTRYGFLNRAQTMIIDYDDPTLTVKDYVLMLYVSYQTEDIQNLVATFPSAVLETMFEPIAKANLAVWCKAWIKNFHNSSKRVSPRYYNKIKEMSLG
jgi:hypothetical protein